MAVEVARSAKEEVAAVGVGAYAHALPPSSRGSQIHRFLEGSSIFVLLMSIALGVWRVGVVADWSNIAWILASIGLGYVLADLGSGVVHWLGDRYGSPEMPVLGKAFVQPFRRHHVAPKEMTEHDFIETNGNNSIVTLPVVGAAFWLFPLETTLGLVAFCSVVSLAAWIFATNQIHSWSHQADVGPVITWLQRRHIILEPRHHDVHHTAPFETYYCITSGILNPILHRIRFWTRMEWLMLKVLGLPPYKDTVPSTKG
jgi:plasmanylethanolamine desaturase